jgi:hypothetical protein
MEDKNDLTEVFNSIFTSLVESEEKETKVKYAEIIKSLKNSKYDFIKPEIFDCMINYQIDKILRIVVSEICEAPHDMSNSNKIYFLFDNYTFIKSNIEKLIIKKESMSCCVDKSRHIILAYKDYLIRGFIPELDGERHYNVFNFGDYKDWFDFCDSLYSLYYGNPEKYLPAYKKLLDSEVRKYKVIHYFWYIKLTNGIDYMFSDRYTTTYPLEENGELDLGDSWAIGKSNEEKLDYPTWDKSRHFYVIPKSDIVKIHCKTKNEIV